MKKQTGFTLIELMVILAVISIVAGFGVPQIASMIQRNRIATQVNHLSAQLQYARSEAIRRAEPINIKSNNAANWKDGWTIYFDSNDDGVVDAGEELRIIDALDINNFTITGPANDIVFSGDGSSGVEHTLTLTDTVTAKASTIKITVVGSIKLKPYM